MDDSPIPTAVTSMEPSGITLVEEDDVAFTLTLCREINRIYGGYQEGDVLPSENVRGGLDLTLRMLAALQGTVVDGMPALRLQVAAAQAREMSAVLFGTLPSARRAAVAPPAATPVAPPGSGPALSPPRSGSSDRELPPGPGSWPEPQPVGLLERWRRRWSRQPAAMRAALGLVGCAILAAAINVPLAVVALFPNLLMPVAAAAGAGTLATAAYRRAFTARRRHREPGRLVLSP
jgi:hypothetical protein